MTPTFPIQFRVVAAESGAGFELQMVLLSVLQEPEPEVVRVLQTGYQLPEDAMSALAECLTFQLPDMEIYDLAVNQVSQLMDHAQETEGAFQQLNDRLIAAEGILQGVIESQAKVTAPAAQPRGSRLLQPRPTTASDSPGSTSIPSLRRAASTTPTMTSPSSSPVASPVPSQRQVPPVIRTKDLPEPAQDLGSRVHGKPFGGPSRGRWSGSGGGDV